MPTRGLAQVPLFEAIPPEELEGLAAHSTTRTFPKHAIIINEGDVTDALYVILEGCVKIFLVGENGREFVLGTAAAGEYFGELALNGGSRSASVMALEVCRCTVVARTDMQAFVARYPAVALTIMGNLNRRVRALTERVKSLALMDVYGRVARLLLDTAQDPGAAALSLQGVADRVGASRQMVSRVMNDLIAGGYVAREGRRFIILRQPPRAW